MQSDPTNKLIRDICVAEYAARNYSDPKIIQRVQEDTGLNYSSSYIELHQAVNEYKNSKNENPINFLLKFMFED